MLTATLTEHNLIETTGTVEAGDVYPGFCCAGHNWTVAIVDPCKVEPGLTDILGGCHNPACPVAANDMLFHGVSSISLGDFAEKLATEAA